MNILHTSLKGKQRKPKSDIIEEQSEYDQGLHYLQSDQSSLLFSLCEHLHIHKVSQ